MEIKETSTNLVEVIGHYEIYESEARKGTCDAFFILDRADESNRLGNQWTLENARNLVNHQIDAEAFAYENLKANRKYRDVRAAVKDNYEVGALLRYSWGYDQTNIDYFCIVAVSKSGDYVTVLPVKSGAITETGWCQGECVASNEIQFHKKAIRRKLAKDKDGKPFGIAVNSYGWCSLYEGQIDHWTAYH